MKTKFFNQGLKLSPEGASGAPATTGSETTPPATTEKPAEDKGKAGNDQESLYLKELEKLKKQNQQLIQSQKDREIKEAEKNGQYEKLYLEMKQQNESIKAQHKKDRISSKVTLAAKDAGLTKTDFIKLMDTSELDLDDEGSVIGLTEALEAFKGRFPELFTDGGSNTKEDNEKPVPPTDNTRKGFTRGIQPDSLEELNKIIRDKKTSATQRQKAIAKRLTLSLNKK